MSEPSAPRPIKGDKAQNKRAIKLAGAGLGLLLVVFLITHVLGGGSSAKNVSAVIKSSIAAATSSQAKAVPPVAVRKRVVTDPGPAPNTTRDPFRHSGP
jgi:hypothetical protein